MIKRQRVLILLQVINEQEVQGVTRASRLLCKPAAETPRRSREKTNLSIARLTPIQTANKKFTIQGKIFVVLVGFGFLCIDTEKVQTSWFPDL